MKKVKLVIATFAAILAMPAFAQHHHGAELSASQQAYVETMDKMHEPMMMGMMDPDPDVAFIKGMIPHHQGAIDMARVVIEYGQDPEVRQLAENIIQAQEGEIEWMNKWLEERAKKQ